MLKKTVQQVSERRENNAGGLFQHPVDRESLRGRWHCVKTGVEEWYRPIVL